MGFTVVRRRLRLRTRIRIGVLMEICLMLRLRRLGRCLSGRRLGCFLLGGFREVIEGWEGDCGFDGSVVSSNAIQHKDSVYKPKVLNYTVRISDKILITRPRPTSHHNLPAIQASTTAETPQEAQSALIKISSTTSTTMCKKLTLINLLDNARFNTAPIPTLRRLRFQLRTANATKGIHSLLQRIAPPTKKVVSMSSITQPVHNN